MAIIYKSTNKCWQGCGERGNFCTLVEMQMGVASVESSMEISQKLKMELPSDPAIPLLGMYPKKPETLIQRT